jgi:hypothetical protein
VFTADEAFGQNPGLRDWLADRELPYVLATRNDDLLVCPDGRCEQAKVLATLAGSVPAAGSTLRHGSGAAWATAHGERVYDWTAIALDPAGLPDGWAHWRLVRQQTEPGRGKTAPERAYYRCAGPAATPLRELIRISGTRWRSRNASRPPRTRPGSTTTRSAPGEPGTPTSPWP